MKKIVVRNGLFAGAILVTLMTVSMLLTDESTNFRLAEILGYLSMVLAFVFIFMGIREYRDKYQGGFITFGRGFQVGILITLIASLLYVAGWMILSNTVATDFGDQYYEQFIQNIRDSDMAEDKKEAQIAKYERNKEMYQNPLVQVGVSFLEIFPVGLLVTLLSALVLRKGKK